MSTQEKLDELLVKFQEIYNDFTDLQEKNSNLKKQLEEWKTSVKSSNKIKYNDMTRIVEEVLESINGESIQISDYEVSIGYDNRVELEYCYLDTNVNDFNVRNIVDSSLSEYLQKNEYNIGFTIKGSNDNSSKEVNEFVQWEGYTDNKAISSVRDILKDEISKLNEAVDADEDKLVATGIFPREAFADYPDNYKFELVKVELVKNETH